MSEERAIDMARANAALSRTEAFMIFSKLHRMLLAVNTSAMAALSGDTEAARTFSFTARDVSREVSLELEKLIYGEEVVDHES